MEAKGRVTRGNWHQYRAGILEGQARYQIPSGWSLCDRGPVLGMCLRKLVAMLLYSNLKCFTFSVFIFVLFLSPPPPLPSDSLPFKKQFT